MLCVLSADRISRYIIGNMRCYLCPRESNHMMRRPLMHREQQRKTHLVRSNSILDSTAVRVRSDSSTQTMKEVNRSAFFFGEKLSVARLCQCNVIDISGAKCKGNTEITGRAGETTAVTCLSSAGLHSPGGGERRKNWPFWAEIPR